MVKARLGAVAIATGLVFATDLANAHGSVDASIRSGEEELLSWDPSGDHEAGQAWNPTPVANTSGGRELLDIDYVSREGVIRALVIVPTRQDNNGLPDDIDEFWDKMDSIYREVEDYFEENSAGRFSIKFDIPRVFKTSSGFTSDNCDPSSPKKCVGFGDGIRWIQEMELDGLLPRPMDEYERNIFAFYEGCPCLPLGGAAVHGKNVVIGTTHNNALIELIIAHELGHTNGAGHAGYGNDVYGNPYAIMGNSGKWPSQHFSLPGKVAFDWVKASTQVSTFARPGHLECDLPDGSVCVPGGQVTIEAVDYGTYKSGTKYGARILTGIPGMHLWLEYRNKYEDLNGLQGLVMTLSSENAAIGPNADQQVSTYGRTLLFGARPNGNTNAQLLVGDTFTFDLDGTGAKISVIKRSSNKRRITFSVEFVPLAADIDYAHSGDTSVEDVLFCDSSTRATVADPSLSGAKLPLYRMFVEQPSDVRLRSLGCRITGRPSIGTVYLYDSYPLALFEDRSLDPALGAVASFEVRCDGNMDMASLVLGNGFLPMAQDYYVLVVGSGETDALSSIWLEASCKPTEQCRINFYRQGSECKQCPLGKRAPIGATSEAMCYSFVDEFELVSSDQPAVAGTYVRSTGSVRNAHYWERTDKGAYIFKSGDKWRAKLQGSTTTIDITSSLVSTMMHPLVAGTSFSNGRDSFQIRPNVNSAPAEGRYSNEVQLKEESWANQAFQTSPQPASGASSVKFVSIVFVLCHLLLIKS